MGKNGVIDLVQDLNDALDKANRLLSENASVEHAENWDRKYINDLPNAAFAVVEKAYKEGKDKRMRHLPHHNKSVKSPTENSSVDLSHYRNALARVNQIKSVSGKESSSALRKKAARHLEKHRSVLKKEKSNFNVEYLEVWVECEHLFKNKVKPLLS